MTITRKSTLGGGYFGTVTTNWGHTAFRAGWKLIEKEDMAKIYRIRKLTARECFRLMGVNETDIDKIKDAGLTVGKTELGNPFFDQANLVIECRMIYTGKWDLDKLDDSIKSAFYRDGELRPMHQQFIAEIVHVWKK